MSRIFVRRISSSLGLSSSYPHICIIGSGPAGFYTAQQVLKGLPDAQVDIFEKLPVPFGLVRYGVAPDHPDVKNCINTFVESAKNERVSFFGNVAIGKDVTFNQLRKAYHAVVLAYGSSNDRYLNIPGENLPNVIAARKFVGWYNGLPEDSNLELDLSVEDVGVIGQGNVAIDVARILLASIDNLKKTDIPEPVLEKLSKSRVKTVTMIGRRRAQDVSFTIKEVREMINLKNCQPIFNKDDFNNLASLIPDAERSKKRLFQLLYQTSVEPTTKQIAEWKEATKEWRLKFLRSPLEIIANENGTGLKGILLGINRIDSDGKAITTGGQTELFNCGLVLRSIGYTSQKIDSSIPFDEKNGIIPNEGGKVIGHEGLYVSGWLGSGPVGVLLSTMMGAFATGKRLVSDWKSGTIEADQSKEGKKPIIQILAQKQIRPVSFDDWNSLDKFEMEEGKRFGKPREKVVDVNKMIDIVHNKDLLN